jgi:hypothetical protein
MYIRMRGRRHLGRPYVFLSLSHTCEELCQLVLTQQTTHRTKSSSKGGGSSPRQTEDSALTAYERAMNVPSIPAAAPHSPAMWSSAFPSVGSDALLTVRGKVGSQHLTTQEPH